MEGHGACGAGVDELLHQRIAAGAHLIRRALRGHAAAAQNDHMIGHTEGLFHIMRHENGSQTHGIVELTNQLCRGAQRNRIETGKRLVIHDEFGVQRNRAGQRYTARHTTRNFAGHELARTAQAHGVQLHQHDVANQLFRQIGVLAQWEGHVVKHAHIREQGTKLEQHAHAATRGVQLPGIHRGDILAVEQHLTLLGVVLPANQAQHRGFATARRAHQRRHFAAWHLQREVAQDDAFTIAKGDIAQFHKEFVR